MNSIDFRVLFSLFSLSKLFSVKELFLWIVCLDVRVGFVIK